MANSVLQSRDKKFSFRNMQSLMEHLGSFNCESQVIAMDGANAENIQSTGTKLAMLNNQPVVLAADAELDISADTEGTLSNWATATSYSVGDVVASLEGGIRIRCIQAHTSIQNVDDDPGAPANEPFVSSRWDLYWEEAPHGAVNASGDVIAAGEEKYYMVTAKADGVLTMWIAGDAAAAGAALCEIPQTDAKMYVPVAFILVSNGSGGDHTIGTDDFDAASITSTFMQLVGPVMPHEDNWDRN